MSSESKDRRGSLLGISQYLNSTRLMVLLILCLQNSMFTVLRRYSQGVLKESYSKHEVLLMGEIIKIGYSAWMISQSLPAGTSLIPRLQYLMETCKKMMVLAMIYGAMNILSFISLQNISAGMFTIIAQCKIMTTASFSTIILNRRYSWAKWRALFSLMLGVLLFSEPIWGKTSSLRVSDGGNAFIGTAAVMVEVSLSGFASIYFEKVIKTDPLQLNIWERNFQLALGSFPVYLLFIASNMGGEVGIGGGWSIYAILLSALGAAGGLLVALSIKYGDSILKTLATTGSIILSSILDYWLLDGPLTPTMMIAGLQVIVSICNYSFDTSPALGTPLQAPPIHESPVPEKIIEAPKSNGSGSKVIPRKPSIDSVASLTDLVGAEEGNLTVHDTKSLDDKA